MANLTPGSNIDLGEVIEVTNSDPLITLRAHSVDAYASLEQSLSMLFASLLGASPDRASIVFYRIVNTKSRNTIISKLMRKEFGEQYGTWWNSLLKQIRKLDERRNEIIHWHVVTNIHSSDEGNTATLTLSAPGAYLEPERSEALGASDLLYFCKQASFVSRFLNMFHMHTRIQALPPPWPEIFQQGVTYPPDQVHPLALPQHTPDSQPPA